MNMGIFDSRIRGWKREHHERADQNSLGQLMLTVSFQNVVTLIFILV